MTTENDKVLVSELQTKSKDKTGEQKTGLSSWDVVEWSQLPA